MLLAAKLKLLAKRPEIYFYISVLIGLILSITSLAALHSATAGLVVTSTSAGQIPLTIFRDNSLEARPVVVIAHGFAGSQQLMHPLAVTLARNGYIAITFDFAGHGRNAQPMSGGIKDMGRSTEHLLSEIDVIVRLARTIDGANGQVALAGHSMAAELVVQYAMQKNGIEATIALSLFGKAVTAESPRNLLVITGAWEPAALKNAGFRIAGLATKDLPQERMTYGDISAGTARRMVLSSGTEHIGVIYSRDALQETTGWLNAVFNRTSQGYIESRGKWIGLLLLGLLLLARPCCLLLPRVTERISHARVAGWRTLWPVALVPAVATPLLLWKIPTDFLPILLGDYLAAHFVVYGVITVAVLKLVQRKQANAQQYGPIHWKALGVSSICIAVYQIVIMGIPVDWYVTSFAPSGLRWLIIPAMFAATALYFLADAALLRHFADVRGAYALTKFLFAVSLAIAVALNPGKLFFLAIIVPVICLFFIVYGLISRWSLRATGEPYAAAFGNALALAWAIAVTFPIVS